jgi:hypothetical protein
MPDPISAIVGGSVVAGVTGLVGADKAADAAKSANSATVNEQRRQYDTTREDFRPYREVGVGALGALADIYGVDRPRDRAPSPFADIAQIAAPSSWQGTAAEWDRYVVGVLMGHEPAVSGPKGINAGLRQYIDRQVQVQRQLGTSGQRGYYLKGDLAPGGGTAGDNFTIGGGDSIGDVGFGGGARVDRTAGFYTSPGYQFRLSEGQKAIERGAAARGRLFSGAALKATENYAQGVASDEWGRYVAGLQSLAGVGQSATGSTAAAGANAANVISSSNTAAGAQRGSAYIAGAEGVNNAVQGGIGNWVLYNATR